MTLDEKIAQARCHVDSGRSVIERQRALVARHGMPWSIELPECFERTQQIFETDLADLLKKVKGARVLRLVACDRDRVVREDARRPTG
jgi:hypothetical protein